MSAFGSIYGGMAANAQGKYAAAVEERNAAMDRAAAQDALQRGRIEEARQYRRMSQLMGQQRAAMAANGIEVDFGSALALQDDTKRIGWEDAATIRENAMRESKGYEISSWNRLAGAEEARAKGKAALIGSIFDAGGTLLDGASQVKKMNANRNPGGGKSVPTPKGTPASWLGKA